MVEQMVRWVRKIYKKDEPKKHNEKSSLMSFSVLKVKLESLSSVLQLYLKSY